MSDIAFSDNLPFEQRLAREMRTKLLLIAGPRSDCDTRESMIARAARRAEITFRQAKSLFYAESADPRASVVDRVRRAADAYLEVKELSDDRYAEELAKLHERLAALEAASVERATGEASRPVS